MADVAYQIELAAQMTGADIATGQLRELQNALIDTGYGAASFDSAIDQVKSALAAAQVESESAANELEIVSNTYKSLGVAAEKAQKAVERATIKGQDTTEFVKSLENARKAVEQYAGVYDAVVEKAKKAGEKESHLAGVLGNLQAAAAKAKPPMQEASRSLSDVLDLTKTAGGVAGKAAGMLGKVHVSLGKGGVAGVAVLAVASLGKLVVSLYRVVKAGTGLVASITRAYFSLAKFALQSNKTSFDRYNKAIATAKSNIGGLFKGVKTGEFVKAVENVTSIFRSGRSEATALQGLFERMLNPLFEQSEPLGRIVKNVLRGMILGVLDVEIAFIRASTVVKKFIPPSLIRDIDSVNTALKLGEYAVKGVVVGLGLIGAAAVVAFGALATVLGGIASALTTMFGPIIASVVALGAGIAAATAIGVAGFYGLIATVHKYWDTIKSAGSAIMQWGIDAKNAVSSLIQGLVAGITGGYGAVVAAMKGLASAGLGAFKGALGIKSPSIVMRQMGIYTVKGVEYGIERESPKAEKAMYELSDSLAAPLANPRDFAIGTQPLATTPQPPATTTQSTVIDLTGATFNFGENMDGKHAARDFVEALQSYLAGEVIVQGGSI